MVSYFGSDISNMDGVLIVNKELGWTSHDVVAKLRSILGVRKIGHTGTLDPAATGVLVILIGKATRILRFLDDNQKEYIAEIRLGISTDTLDAEGRVEKITEVPWTSLDSIKAICKGFEGEIEQIPPVYSAVKIGGQRLYQLARKGRAVHPSPRRVNIYEIEVVNWQPPSLVLRVVCSRGTYIRTLAADIGGKLGCGGHLSGLRRVRSGEFTIDRALSVEDITVLAKAGDLAPNIMSIDDALKRFPYVKLNPDEADRFKHGGALKLSTTFDGATTVRVRNSEGHLLGVAKLDLAQNMMRPVCVLQ
ncbi:MAG TPA: tRNA pseudouridine(55) synthase TruB [Candidatus Latescibacteria bacterium]|nr:tRNA pseudouridine(55) synthase TruB [Candidatus Latescibacterota bacterium]